MACSPYSVQCKWAYAPGEAFAIRTAISDASQVFLNSEKTIGLFIYVRTGSPCVSRLRFFVAGNMSGVGCNEKH